MTSISNALGWLAIDCSKTGWSMKIVFLDMKTLGFPVDVSGLYRFGQVELYDYLSDEDVAGAIEDADILITNYPDRAKAVAG